MSLDAVKQTKIFKQIAVERIRQEGVHPDYPWQDGHTQMERYEVLSSEVFEVLTALRLQRHENLREELVQVAAVCVRWLEVMS